MHLTVHHHHRFISFRSGLARHRCHVVLLARRPANRIEECPWSTRRGSTCPHSPPRVSFSQTGLDRTDQIRPAPYKAAFSAAPIDPFPTRSPIMEFPHHHHHHGHRRDDDEDDRRGPPPPVYGGYGQPPPPDPYGRAPVDPDPYGRPPPQSAYGGAGDAYGHSGQGYAPPPAYGAGGGYGNVVHVAHEVGDERPYYGGGGGGLGGAYGGGGSEYGHEGRPHHGGGGSQYGHETRPHHGGGGGAPPVRQQTYRIYCKAGEDQYSLASRDGKVCLVRTDRDDDAQVTIAVAPCLAKDICSILLYPALAVGR